MPAKRRRLNRQDSCNDALAASIIRSADADSDEDDLAATINNTHHSDDLAGLIANRKTPQSRAAHARNVKLKHSHPAQPKHVKTRIAAYNANEAVHVKDKISDQRALPKLGGMVQNKLLAAAMLRSCFGRRNHMNMCARSKEVRRREFRNAKRRHDAILQGRSLSLHTSLRKCPLATSTNAMAESMTSTTTHVQKVRNACAETIRMKIVERMFAMGDSEHANFGITMDETEHTLSRLTPLRTIKKTLIRHITKSIMMGHLIMVKSIASGTSTTYDRFEVPLRPAVLVDTKAPTVLEYFKQRIDLEQELKKLKMATFNFTTDSAKSMRKAFKLIWTWVNRICLEVRKKSLHWRCSLHKLSSSIKSATSPLDTLGKLFCGTTIMHRGAVNTCVVQGIRNHVMTTARITTTPPDPDETIIKRNFLSLIMWTDSAFQHRDLDVHSKNDAARRDAFERLLKIDASPLNSDRILIYIPPGKLVTRQAAAEEFWDLLQVCYLCRLPPIPKVSDWTHLFGATSWWTVFAGYHKLGRIGWKCLPGVAKTLGDHVTADWVYGVMPDDATRQIIRSRPKRMRQWEVRP
jgi:hypothetical protein